ncbi:MAG: HlyD family secretion protein, partial [Planctomycetaceae bacterium]
QVQLLKQAQFETGVAAVAAPTAGQPVATPAAGAGPESPPATATGVADSGGVVHESKGYLLPRHQILISPKVGGMVKSLRVRPPGSDDAAGQQLIEGMQVNKGDILAQLETTDYDADVLHAEANVARAQLRLEMERKNLPREIERANAELAEAVEMRDFYKSQYDRWAKLSRTSTVSPADIEKAESDMQAAGHRVDKLRRALDLIVEPQEQRLKVAESDVAVAQAELTKSKWRRGNTVITAPVTGTVLKKNVEEGNIVNPGAFNGSFSICDLADLADLEVELDIQERDIARIFTGQKCVVRAEAFQDHPYEGYVSRLMPIANRSKGAIPVRVKVLIPAGMEGVHLKPEMGAIVAFYKQKVDPDTATAATARAAAEEVPESSSAHP